MKVSEFVSEIVGYTSMPALGLLLVLLLAVVCGTVANKVISGIRSNVALCLVAIVLLSIILGNVGHGLSLPVILLTECLVFVGREAYRRMLIS